MMLHNRHLEGEPFLWEAGDNAVLLIHGLTATPTEVRRLAKELHGQGYTVAGPLLPGHRQTPASLNRTRWQDWYQSVERAYLAMSARYEHVFVGGESCGGLLALLLAARHPAITGVMAYAPALQLPLSPLRVLTLHLLAPFVTGLPKPHVLKNTTWQGYTVNPLKSILQLLQLQAVVRQELSKIQQPLLIVQGRMDNTIDQRSAEMVYNGVRSCQKEIHWLDHSDHCLLLDYELDQAAQWTLAFLSRHSSAVETLS